MAAEGMLLFGTLPMVAFGDLKLVERTSLPVALPLACPAPCPPCPFCPSPLLPAAPPSAYLAPALISPATPDLQFPRLAHVQRHWCLLTCP